MTEFAAWPKTPRLFSPSPAAPKSNDKDFVIVTEKIDGTNAAVLIEPAPYWSPSTRSDTWRPIFEPVIDTVYDDEKHEAWHVYAQSRKRFVTPSSDNYGFATWVKNNATELVRDLGVGRHFGEWWGSGIQRGYGLTNGDRRFSLFNVQRYSYVGQMNYGLRLVPVLDRFDFFSTGMISAVLEVLKEQGSYASPGFRSPEGVIVYHKALNGTFKAFVEDL